MTCGGDIKLQKFGGGAPPKKHSDNHITIYYTNRMIYGWYNPNISARKLKYVF